MARGPAGNVRGHRRLTRASGPGGDNAGLPPCPVRHRRGRTNLLVNSGAIATVDLVAGPDHAARWQAIHAGLSRFAGRDLALDDESCASASQSNHRNRALAALLQSLGTLTRDPVETVALYTRQSCLAVTARDLAIMGATLANGGVNPHTGVRVVSAESCRYALTVMTTAGLYETSGDWLYRVGPPGQERYRRRDRHGVAGQRRPGDLLTTAG